MKSKEIFSVAVRIVGLAFLYQGLEYVLGAVGAVYQMMPQFNFKLVLMSLFAVAWRLGLAWWMVRGAPWLMRIAYPPGDPSSPDSNQ